MVQPTPEVSADMVGFQRELGAEMSKNNCSVKRLPRAPLAIFEHSGHYPFIEEPIEFSRALAKFLAA